MRAQRQAQDHDPRRRAEPHRAGHRVRLLLRARGLRAAGARIRNHHGQFESGDGFDRLRHERQTLLRAAHARGRAQHLRPGTAGRRHRAVRRADAAESRGRIAGRRRSDHRHPAGKHRDGRGPEIIRRDARQARAAPDAERHRGQRGGSDFDRAEDRLSGAGASVVCARRPRDGARLQRRRSAPLHAERGRGQPGSAGPGRSLSRRRDRSRRRLHRGRRDQRDRRDHGAHRTGRHSQRRQRLRHSHLLAFGGSPAKRSPPRPRRWRAN